MDETLEKLRNINQLRRALTHLVTPASIVAAVAILFGTWYFMYLFDTFVTSNLKALPGSALELAIPYYNVFKQITGKMRERIISAHEKKGSIVRNVPPDKISIADLDTLQHLLKLTDIPKHKATYSRIQPIEGRPAIAQSLDPEDHRRLRRVIAPAFSIKYLMGLEPLLLQVCRSLERKILSMPRDSDGYITLDLFKAMHHVAADMIGITTFGGTFCLVENGQHPLPTSVAQIIKATAIRIAIPPFARDVYNKLVYDQINDFQYNFIKDSIHKRQAANANANDGVYTDILQWIVDHGDKGVFDEVDMVNMARTMLTAGGETSANTMAWATSLLVSNPSTLERLRTELDDAFPGSPNQALPLETLKRLPYLDAVLHETLRLKPIVSKVYREFEKDTELSVRDDDGNPKTYTIPAGTMTYIPIAAVQTSSKVWLRANDFYPERWLNDTNTVTEEEVSQFGIDGNAHTKSSSGINKSKGGHWGKPVLCNKQAFMPFSLGARDCVGRNFAWNEMRIILGHIIRRFDILPAYDTSVEVPGVDFIAYQISRPDGLPIKLKPRV
ncbi:cytochrome P450 [Gonapodya prolifera JEL478]|uniref:Cytochrome P450 n=1 Tax=Gonapodya prolifera (strain JEL478) TaxID=1344416 RepID=A0A139AJ49_GONPJ|nr:cytochrome P450 [Gonapodya prolifera JEL478]|eukprot:KXS16584.1 cytochrome P450 [Gonapodya prolifera JEL478]